MHDKGKINSNVIISILECGILLDDIHVSCMVSIYIYIYIVGNIRLY